MKPIAMTTEQIRNKQSPRRLRAAQRSVAVHHGPTSIGADRPETTEARSPTLWARCTTCGDSVPVPFDLAKSGIRPSVVLRDERDRRKESLHCLACGEAAMRLRVDGDYGRSVNLAVFRHAVAIARLPTSSGLRARLAQLEEEEQACRQAFAAKRLARNYELFDGEVVDFVEDLSVLATPNAAAFRIAAYYEVLMSMLVRGLFEDGFRLPF